jgi:hypothetical protein
MICTIEVPAGVTGVLGGVGVVGGGVVVAAVLPPQPMIVPVPASRATRKTSRKPRGENLRRLTARAKGINPGAQNAAAGRREAFSVGEPIQRSSFALPPAVCMVTTTDCTPLVPVNATVAGLKLQVAFCGRF